MDRDNVLIYLHSILGPSMTFVKAHVDNLKRYRGIYAGARRCPGLQVDEERCITVNSHGTAAEKVGEKLFRLTGIAPDFYRRIAQRRPRLVHAHFGTSAPAALRISRRLCCPLLVTFHGRDATMSEREARRSFRGSEMLRTRAQVSHGASAIIAVSAFIRDRLLAAGFPDDKLIVHYNGVDTSRFAPDPSIEREKVVLFVGRLVEKKGVIYLLRAIEELHASLPDASAVILGDGPEEKILRRMSLERGLPVSFQGFQPPESVRRWMNRASVLAVPSVTASDGDSEGLPTVLVEAQSMGLPVVATRHSGIPEALIDGGTGYLVGERDSHGLAGRIGELLADDARRADFGTRARRFARERFDLHRQLEKLEYLYDAVLEPRHAKAA